MEFGYLERLTIQLTAGAALLDDVLVKPHLDFVLRSQKQDGGWGGREGDSDLYYTSFALRSLAILGSLTGEVAERASQFLLKKTQSQESIIDLLSLVYGAALIEAATEINPLQGNREVWQSRMQSMLHQLRRSDGGFARTLEANVGSTYQTFLVAICLELMGYSLPADDPCVDFLLAQRRADGGFLEVRVAKRSGANPTAAAIGALRAATVVVAYFTYSGCFASSSSGCCKAAWIARRPVGASLVRFVAPAVSFDSAIARFI